MTLTFDSGTNQRDVLAGMLPKTTMPNINAIYWETYEKKCDRQCTCAPGRMEHWIPIHPSNTPLISEGRGMLVNVTVYHSIGNVNVFPNISKQLSCFIVF